MGVVFGGRPRGEHDASLLGDVPQAAYIPAFRVSHPRPFIVTQSPFLYVGCQPGVDAACKQSVLAAHPELRFSFSRPGFQTFKRESDFPRGFAPRSAFARVSGLSLNKVSGDLESRSAEFWELAPNADHLHVWARTDRLERAEDEPSALLAAVQCLEPGAAERGLPVNRVARPNQSVLDCMVVEPDQWWIGWRETSSPPSRWVGGVPPIEAPSNMVSRAYLKMKEALLWSRLPIRGGDVVVEIGSAPGGACQALLETGAQVIGIDPAEMDPIVLAHPNFTHIQRRGAEIRRKDLSSVKWLCVDSNVAPQHTLDTLAALHEHDQVQFSGMLITLKMLDMSLAENLESYLAQIRQFGYQVAKPRHLYYNRQELCVAVARTPSVFRKPRKKRR